MKRILFLIMLFSIGYLSSCQKCDPFFPTDCKDCYENLVGEWTLDYLATNGIDSVSYFDSIFLIPSTLTIGPRDPSDDIDPGLYFHYGYLSGIHYWTGGQWARITDDSYFVLGGLGSPNTNSAYPFTNWTDTLLWKINKLTHTDFWFGRDNNGNYYEMHLKK